MTSGSKQDSPVFPRSAGGKWRLLASDTMWGKLRGLDDGKPYTSCSMLKNEPHPSILLALTNTLKLRYWSPFQGDLKVHKEQKHAIRRYPSCHRRDGECIPQRRVLYPGTGHALDEEDRESG